MTDENGAETAVVESIAADRQLVDGVMEINRALGIMGSHLLDVGVALVMVNVQAGPKGSPTTNGALNALHAAQDEIAAAQRTLMRLLETVRARAEEE